MIARPLKSLTIQVDSLEREKRVLVSAIKLLLDRIERGIVTAEVLVLAREAVRTVEPIDAEPADVSPLNAGKPTWTPTRPSA